MFDRMDVRLHAMSASENYEFTDAKERRLYEDYRKCERESLQGVLEIISDPEDRRRYEEARRPLSPAEFHQRLAKMDQGARTLLEQRLQTSYEERKMTWAREVDELMASRFSTER